MKNCTKHDIVVRLSDGTDRVYPPSGKLAVVDPEYAPAGAYDGVSCVRRTFGAVILPVFPPSEILIVPSLVLEALKSEGKGQHNDCVAPDTGPTAIRNDKGQVIAVTRFVRN